jgi:hypothetical protein
MIHCWTVACRVSSIDEGVTNNVTLASTLETLNLAPEIIAAIEKQSTEPGQSVVIPFDHSVVYWFVRSDLDKAERIQARAFLRLPSGKKQESGADFTIRLDEASSYRFRINVPGIPFHGFGRYWYEVETLAGDRWVRSKVRCPIHVRPQPSAAD